MLLVINILFSVSVRKVWHGFCYNINQIHIMIRELKSSSIVSVTPISEQNEKITDNLNEFGTIIVI